VTDVLTDWRFADDASQQGEEKGGGEGDQSSRRNNSLRPSSQGNLGNLSGRRGNSSSSSSISSLHTKSPSPRPDLLPGIKSKAIMASPVRDFLGRVLGVITTASATGSPFVQEDQELFEALAVFGTSTIKHTQVLEEARARTEEAEVMNDVGRLLTADIGTAMVVPRIISAAYSIIKCERVTLFNIESVQVMDSQQVSEESKEIVCIVSKDSNFVGTRIAWGSGIVGHVAMTRKPLNIHNAYEDSRFFKKADKSTGFTTKSILTVPVCDSRGTGVAIIQAVNKLRDPDEVYPDDHTASFSEHDVHLLESLAVIAGTALEKSKLYYKAKAAERKAHALLSLLNVQLNRHHSFVMDDFKTITRQALDCEHCTILFVDRSRGQMFSADFSSLNISYQEKNFVSECAKTGKESTR
jgi:GAF domain-containing protein